MNSIPAAVQIIRQAFPGISQAEANELVAIGEVKPYAPGVILCKENAIEETFFIILEGEVAVTKIINADENRALKHLGEGDFFGEMGLIHNAPRAATVETISPVRVLEIHKTGFDRLLQKTSSMSLAMVREVSRRLSENDEMAIEDLRLKAGELASAYQRLAQEELARREFLTTIAHELRTPLTTARGFLEMLRFHELDTTQRDEILLTVARNVEQIVTLVNDILFLQEVELLEPEMHPVDVSELLTGAVKSLSSEAQKANIHIHLKAASAIPQVMGHARSLQRAFSQLLDNAIKYSSAGSEVVISIESGSDGVCVSIADQGVGIPEHIRPYIFDRYFHLEEVGDNLYGGLGLGLAITKQVVEQHKGRIEVESQEGKGSTFIVILPELSGGLVEF
ncbi:MAG: cyclic nucleotide-binding domain-containing protein [Chloroflexi bacterium]|jgi:signal transduction histidine kinase|nr:cyclic nucleotide-binding domain-containing protein [Chloroflexota bacterium]